MSQLLSSEDIKARLPHIDEWKFGWVISIFNIKHPVLNVFFRPLHLAASRGELKVVDGLLKAGVKVNSLSKIQCTSEIFVSNMKSTALLEAVESAHTEPVKYLLQKGADPNIQNSDGDTPMHKAVLIKDEKLKYWIVDYLLTYGRNIDVLIRNKAGVRPVDLPGGEDLLINKFGKLDRYNNNNNTNIVVLYHQVKIVQIVKK